MKHKFRLSRSDLNVLQMGLKQFVNNAPQSNYTQALLVLELQDICDWMEIKLMDKEKQSFLIGWKKRHVYAFLGYANYMIVNYESMTHSMIILHNLRNEMLQKYPLKK